MMEFEAISYTQGKAPSQMFDKAINKPLICIYNTSANIGFSDLVQPNRINFDMIYYLFLRDV